MYALLSKSGPLRNYSGQEAYCCHPLCAHPHMLTSHLGRPVKNLLDPMPELKIELSDWPQVQGLGTATALVVTDRSCPLAHPTLLPLGDLAKLGPKGLVTLNHNVLRPGGGC